MEAIMADPGKKLLWAAENGNIQVVRELLDGVTKTHRELPEGDTKTHRELLEGDTKTHRELLEGDIITQLKEGDIRHTGTNTIESPLETQWARTGLKGSHS